MKKFSYKLLLIFSFAMIFGSATSAFANGNDTKRPKNTGILTVKTSPGSYPVLVDGVQVGMSGVGQDAEFYLTPGTHKVEVLGPDGKVWSKEITSIKDRKTCICLKMVETEIRTPCPYNMSIDGPDKVEDGALVTFTVRNTPTQGSTQNPLKYVWTITPESARITSGLGTDTITVDTTGLAGQSVIASVETTDGFYDAQCRQIKTISTEITPIPEKPREYEVLDSFVFKVFDDAKARLDNYFTELNTRRDGSGYLIFYQGTDKGSPNAEKTAVKVKEYLVKVRGMDPNKIQIVQGGTRKQTTISLNVIYPGGTIPAP